MVSAGSPVTCTAADTAYPLSAVHKLVKTIIIQPRYDNGGVLFIGSSALVPSTNTGVFKQLQQPAADNIPAFELTEQGGPNPIDIANFYVSSSQSGDVVLWSYNEG